MLKKPQILFVEDDLELGPLLVRVLGEHGYTTQWVTSAEDALLQMPAVSPHLIICDRMLPGMDGLLFCKRVRSLGHTLQILMLTALNAESNWWRAWMRAPTITWASPLATWYGWPSCGPCFAG